VSAWTPAAKSKDTSAPPRIAKDDASFFTEPVEDLAEHQAHRNQYRGPNVNVHAASFARSQCQRTVGPRVIPPSSIHWLVIDGEMIGAVPLTPADGGTRLVQTTTYRGLLARMSGQHRHPHPGQLRRPLNEAIKQRAENDQGSSGGGMPH
jgi:hypothetical protein